MQNRKKIQIAGPTVGVGEERAVLNVLRSGMLAQGVQVERFEEEFAKYCGVKYAVAVANGTCALHLALLACGIGAGDEVITTPFSFIATANAITFTGAKPVFVDIEKDSFNIDPKKIVSKITKKTKAILPVHLFGNPADMAAIHKIAKEHNLKVVEDACQAHGAVFEGKKVGSIGDFGCFSFYPTKNMTTGEGGMVTTNTKSYYEKIKLLRNHGMKKRYYHEMIGFNYRMTDINAAIGTVQLQKLPDFNKRRVQIAKQYSMKLSFVPEIIMPQMQSGSVFNQYSILVPRKLRDKLFDFLSDNGIHAGIYYPVPIHMQKPYRGSGKYPVSEIISKQIVSLPIYPGLTGEQIALISRSVLKFFSKKQKSKKQ